MEAQATHIDLDAILFVGAMVVLLALFVYGMIALVIPKFKNIFNSHIQFAVLPNGIGHVSIASFSTVDQQYIQRVIRLNCYMRVALSIFLYGGLLLLIGYSIQSQFLKLNVSEFRQYVIALLILLAIASYLPYYVLEHKYQRNLHVTLSQKQNVFMQSNLLPQIAMLMPAALIALIFTAVAIEIPYELVRTFMPKPHDQILFWMARAIIYGSAIFLLYHIVNCVKILLPNQIEQYYCFLRPYLIIDSQKIIIATENINAISKQAIALEKSTQEYLDYPLSAIESVDLIGYRLKLVIHSGDFVFSVRLFPAHRQAVADIMKPYKQQ